jgi:hypothetical protein
VATHPDNPLLDPDRAASLRSRHARARRPRHPRAARELGGELDRLEASAEPSSDAVVEPITRITDRLALVWGQSAT